MSDRRVVWKYAVGMDKFTLPLPIGARVLCVQMQHAMPEMWVLVDPNLNLGKVWRRFHLVGTGHEHDAADLPYEGYVGTFQVSQGTFIFHLFELKETQ